MHRLLPVCALTVALAFGAAIAPAQALPVSGLSIVPADQARALSVVDKAGWVRGRWHRYWWRRWRRY